MILAIYFETVSQTSGGVFEFRKGGNAMVAATNICDIYPNALNVLSVKNCFSKFKSGSSDRSDSCQSGRPTTLDVEKCPTIVNGKYVILQHENAEPHCTRQILEKINDLGWEVLPNPYSPDVTPLDFHLFRSPQHFQSGKQFESSDDVPRSFAQQHY
ncbi:hypothetical protein GQX74_014487, partial [Glossina fuscipes]